MCDEWGAALATYHARGDQDYNATLVPYSLEKMVHDLVNGDDTAFDALVWQHASTYADQVAIDWSTWAATH